MVAFRARVYGFFIASFCCNSHLPRNKRPVTETKQTMTSFYINFLKNLLIFSLIIVIIYIVLSYSIPGRWLSIALPFLFPFYIATTLISCHLVLRALHNHFNTFVNRYMLITAIKLVWYAIILVLYIVFFPADAIPFAVNFLILYLCFTIFETIALVRYSRTYPHPSKNNQRK